MLGAYGERPAVDDVRAVLADLYRPRRELSGLSPCDAASAVIGSRRNFAQRRRIENFRRSRRLLAGSV